MSASLNCKPGDMALVISGPDSGKEVHCLALFEAGSLARPPGFCLGIYFKPTMGPVWSIDRTITWTTDDYRRDQFSLPYAPDSVLMPIRPEAEPIEMLEEVSA